MAEAILAGRGRFLAAAPAALAQVDTATIWINQNDRYHSETAADDLIIEDLNTATEDTWTELAFRNRPDRCFLVRAFVQPDSQTIFGARNAEEGVPDSTSHNEVSMSPSGSRQVRFYLRASYQDHSEHIITLSVTVTAGNCFFGTPDRGVLSLRWPGVFDGPRGLPQIECRLGDQPARVRASQRTKAASG